MPAYREIRADYDRESIVVYQAYNSAIADVALKAGRFAPPFSFGRMTWIKPSFLWLMERSNWARKSGQERILAVRISRQGWEEALSKAVLTSFEPSVHHTTDAWRTQFEQASVHVQWDPERSIHGKKLDYRSIQVGLSRQIVGDYVNCWINQIVDLTSLTHKMCRFCEQGHFDRAKKLLPKARRYELNSDTAVRLAMNGD